MSEIFDLDLGMTGAISHFSRYEDAEFKKINGKYTYTGKSKITAYHKISGFYRRTMWFLGLSALLLLAVTNSQVMDIKEDISGVPSENRVTVEK